MTFSKNITTFAHCTKFEYDKVTFSHIDRAIQQQQQKYEEIICVRNKQTFFFTIFNCGYLIRIYPACIFHNSDAM